MWNVELVRTFALKLDLDKRLLLQELPSLDDIAKIVNERKPLVTVINEEVDKAELEIFSESEIRTFKILRGLENDNLFRRLVNYFRHYCFAKTLVELGYTDIDKNIVNTVMIEFPLYNPEYCRDEVRYVYERLKRESSEVLNVLASYPICRSQSPLDVLAHIILDMNLIGARGFVNDFFINFNSNPTECVYRLLAAHLLYFSLPAVSLGSLIKLEPDMFNLIVNSVKPSVITSGRRIALSESDTAAMSMSMYRHTLVTTLDMLSRTYNMLDLPQMLGRLQDYDHRIYKSLGLEPRYKYCVLVLSMPRSRTSLSYSRHISNFGLLVKTVMTV